MSVVTFLLVKLNTLQKKKKKEKEKTRQSLSQLKPWCNDSGVLNLHHS